MTLLHSGAGIRIPRQGVSCTAQNVLIVQGAQQGLDLAAKLFIDPGDLIVTEDPTFLGALIAFNPYQPRYAAVGIDEEGMQVEHLEAQLSRQRNAKLIYVIPDADERVIHVGSCSKILAPGLRTGWMVASPPAIEKLALLKMAADTRCSTLNVAAISLLLETFDLEKHVTRIAAHYRRKKSLMIDTIRRTFPPGSTRSTSSTSGRCRKPRWPTYRAAPSFRGSRGRTTRA